VGCPPALEIIIYVLKAHYALICISEKVLFDVGELL
jgi:hypothetical protein